MIKVRGESGDKWTLHSMHGFWHAYPETNGCDILPW